MRKFLSFLTIICLSISLSSCSNSDENKNIEKPKLDDGIYTGKSSPDERGGYVNVEIEVKDNKIIDCKMENIDGDGNIKDENYGKSANEGLYKIAQNAIKLSESYPKDLVEVGDINGVDAITGATETHKQFVEAVKNALNEE